MEGVAKDDYAALGDTLPKTLWIEDQILRGARRSVLELLQRYGCRSVLDVCSFESLQPEHSENYRRFMAEGGLLSWLQARKGHLHAVRRHLFGNLTVIAVMK